MPVFLFNRILTWISDYNLYFWRRNNLLNTAMKKILISIGSLLIMAAIVILFVNANGSRKEERKAKAAVEASASCCDKSAATATVDHSNCPDMKDGKCDPATCTAHKEGEKKEAEPCATTTACPATCPMAAGAR